MTTRTATATWNGSLLEGSGSITSFESGAIGALPVSWPRRSEAHDGSTSPEELLAAAHASCFAMALSGGLARNNTPATRLDVSATVTFEKVEAGWRVTKSALTLKGMSLALMLRSLRSLPKGRRAVARFPRRSLGTSRSLSRLTPRPRRAPRGSLRRSRAQCAQSPGHQSQTVARSRAGRRPCRWLALWRYREGVRHHPRSWHAPARAR